MLNAPTLRNGLLVGLYYTLIIGVGMAVMNYIFGYDYGKTEMVNVLIFFEFLGCAFVIWAAMRMGGLRANGFGKINWGQLLWFVPSLLIVAVMIGQLLPTLTSSTLTGAQWALIATVVATTFMVGFSEEVAFRGVLLNAALKSTTRLKAMLISAVSFSLLHAVNVFGGLIPVGMLIQLVLTFIAGLYLTPIAMRVGSLWPLIIWHFLWDCLLIVGGYLGVEYVITVAGTEIDLFFINMSINLVLIAVFWTLEIRRARGQSDAPAP
ncbi:MAG: hypothetical protein CR993_01650 [Rhodobacterales bacterium]|nr:MAG: hypothetical protein CR993_01650 [Rhodobacterales bacterium]